MKFIVLLRSILLSVIVLTPIVTHGQVVFNFTYADVDNHSGIGFDDASTGAARRQALQDIGDYIGKSLDYNATITYTIKASQMDGSGSLASAGSGFGLEQDTNMVRGSNMAMAIQGLSTNTTQGYMTVDFGYSWNLSLDAPGSNDYDFRSVVLHEMTHSLGFTSLINKLTGEGLSVSQNGNYYGQTYSIYDSHLVDGSGNPLILDPVEFDSARFTDGSDSDEVIDIFTSHNMFFNGPYAVAVYGSPIPLYAPGIYLEGSSTSHFDTYDPTVENDPMVHAIARGESKREYTALDFAVLRDLGYIVIEIPEPASSSLMGLSLLMLLMKRQRLTAHYC